LTVLGHEAGHLFLAFASVRDPRNPNARPMLGRADSPMIGRVLFDEFFLNRDWPVASAVAVVLLFLLVVPIMIFNHYNAKAEGVE
jgi:putrescine transport system permease protein